MKYSNKDLQPYNPTPYQKAKYNQCLKQYSMPDENFVDVKVYDLAQYPHRPLDERFADFKVRLAFALKNRGIS